MDNVYLYSWSVRVAVRVCLEHMGVQPAGVAGVWHDDHGRVGLHAGWAGHLHLAVYQRGPVPVWRLHPLEVGVVPTWPSSSLAATSS